MTTIDATDVRALQVLADQLQEQGDVRGEFMALQCRQAEGALSDAGRRRVSDLRRQHREHLLGDLYGLVTNARFRRGLIHAARLSVTRRRMEATWNSERWSALEILEVALDGGSWMRKRSADFYNSRPSLHTLVNLGHPPAEPCPRITTVSTSMNLFELEDLLNAFPNLKRLTLKARFDDASTFWKHPRMRQLDVLLLSSAWKVGSLYDPNVGRGAPAKLCWTKDSLHLEEVGLVADFHLKFVARGPRLRSFEVPFRGWEDLDSYLAHDNLRVADLIIAAQRQSAQLVFASSARGYRLYGGEFLPARFLRAIR